MHFSTHYNAHFIFAMNVGNNYEQKCRCF